MTTLTRLHKMIISMIIILSLFSSHVINAAPSGDKSTISVFLPTSIKTTDPKGIFHQEALFGIPAYGSNKKLTGQIIYVTPKPSQTGCSESSGTYPPTSSTGNAKIFLISRGGCSFAQKVRTAQQMGAIAAIIVDDLCLCQSMDVALNPEKGYTQAVKDRCEELAVLDHGKPSREQRIPVSDHCEKDLTFMGDDGTGGDITIPSMIIDTIAAQQMKDCFLTATYDDYVSLSGASCEKSAAIMVDLNWEMPAPDDNVEWEIWTSSDSDGSFKKAFYPTAIGLKPTTTFTPHFFFYKGADWQCDIKSSRESCKDSDAEVCYPCSTQCTNRGIYCNPDPDRNLLAGVSGKDIVLENLRQLCIWKNYVKSEADYHSNGGEMWWRYVIRFAEKCHPRSIPDASLFNERCSQGVHNEIPGLKWADTLACVESSWTDATKTKNTILDAELESRTAKNIVVLPTVIVNGITARGGTTPSAVLSTICSGFLAGSEPALCACVNKETVAQMQACMRSSCPSSQDYCPLNGKCFPKPEFAAKCSVSSCASDQYFCSSLGVCLVTGSADTCPVCSDTRKPFFCEKTKACSASISGCRTGGGDGVSAFGVFMIVILVVGLTTSAFYMYWRQQRDKMREEVRNILSEYVPLEETMPFSSGNGRGNKSTTANGSATVTDVNLI